MHYGDPAICHEVDVQAVQAQGIFEKCGRTPWADIVDSEDDARQAEIKDCEVMIACNREYLKPDVPKWSPGWAALAKFEAELACLQAQCK